MKRIVEPELMNEELQTCAYAKADFEEPNIRFLNLFQKTFSSDIKGHILDIGCGSGDITFRFAKTFSNCFIDGIDGSESMLKHCFQALSQEPLDIQQRVSFVAGIVPKIQLPLSHYDIIISNSVLHHLHHPALLWKFIKMYSVKNSKIFIGDLLRPSSNEEAKKIVELYAKNESEILKLDFYNSLLAAFEISEIKSQLKSANLEHLSVKQISDRHVIVAGSI